MKRRLPVRRDTLRQDAVAGLVLGVESVPDGLAAGLLAGVNPLSGLYAYLFGTIAGGCLTSSSFMAVQATGAMAIVVADVPAVHSASDPARALFTLSMLTGVIMLAAGFLRLGSMLRFVSNSVTVGFISAVGVNIVLGQLASLTGYKATGPNRVIRAVNTFLHPGQFHWQTVAAGIATIALILLLERTKLGPLGLVLAVVITSAGVALLGWTHVAILDDLSAVPRSLPIPAAPMLRLVPVLLLPALSLTFVGLIQGAAISASFPNPEGSFPDASRDFAGQGAANIIAGAFRGMPVGGSMSATALNKAAGARSRQALIIAGVVMANDLTTPGKNLFARYAERMMVGNELDAYIGGFHLDALTSGVPLNVDLDTTLTVVAGNLYRLLALKLSRYERATPGTLWRDFLDATGTLHIDDTGVTCALNLRSHHPALIDAGFAELQAPIPWWGGRTLRFRFPPR